MLILNRIAMSVLVYPFLPDVNLIAMSVLVYPFLPDVNFDKSEHWFKNLGFFFKLKLSVCKIMSCVFQYKI